MKNEMRHSTEGRLERIKVSCLFFTMFRLAMVDYIHGLNSLPLSVNSPKC